MRGYTVYVLVKDVDDGYSDSTTTVEGVYASYYDALVVTRGNTYPGVEFFIEEMIVR